MRNEKCNYVGTKSKTPRVFNQVFSLIDHLYQTRFSGNSFEICDFNLKLTTRFAIGFRDPTKWNEFLTQSEKCYTSIDIFKNKIKGKILHYKTKYFCLFFALVYKLHTYKSRFRA